MLTKKSLALFSALLFALFAASCSNEIEQSDTSQATTQKVEELRIGLPKQDEVTTRLYLTYEGGAVKTNWEVNDSVYVYDRTQQQAYTFVASTVDGDGYATFRRLGDNFMDLGDDYRAIYAVSSSEAIADVVRDSIDVDYKDATYTTVTDLQKNYVLFSKKVVTDVEDIDLNLQAVTPVLVFNFVFPDSVKVKSVSFGSMPDTVTKKNVLYSGGTYSIESDTWSNLSVSDRVINYSTPASGTFSVFVPIVEQTIRNFHIVVTGVDGTVYTYHRDITLDLSRPETYQLNIPYESKFITIVKPDPETPDEPGACKRAKYVFSDGSVGTLKQYPNKTAIALVIAEYDNECELMAYLRPYCGATVTTGGKHGIAIALKDAGYAQWNTSCRPRIDNGWGRQVYNSCRALYDLAGKYYTHGIPFHQEAWAFPAFYKAANYSVAAPSNCSQWFLPSTGQWAVLVNAWGEGHKMTARNAYLNCYSRTRNFNFDCLNEALKAGGGDALTKYNYCGDIYYWTSSERDCYYAMAFRARKNCIVGVGHASKRSCLPVRAMITY